MPFETQTFTDPALVDAGIALSHDGFLQTWTTFENGLLSGRFAKLDAGSIDNIDASASPVIAGVVLRDLSSPVDKDAFTTDSGDVTQVSVLEQGVVAVAVKAGDTPVYRGAINVHNAADADAGKATTGAGVAVDGYFVREIKTGVWLIRLK